MKLLSALLKYLACLPWWLRGILRTKMCGSRKYPLPPPHGRSRKFQGVGVSDIGKFPKGRGATQRVFFPVGVKCN